jgi:hypothetical protein
VVLLGSSVKTASARAKQPGAACSIGSKTSSMKRCTARGSRMLM